MNFFRGCATICLVSLFMLTLLLPKDTYAFGDDKKAEVNDPLESVNRAIYGFNNIFDKFLIKPAAKTYRIVVPKMGRQGIGNILSNLSEPVTFINSTLQCDVDRSFTSFWRFMINSTFGIAGTFDVATLAGLRGRGEDFGQTIGHYGLSSGPYLMLPLLGPSNSRDLIGKVVDVVSNPYNHLVDSDGTIGKSLLEGVDKREELLELTSEIDRTSLDPYATIRSLYTQKRYDDIKNGR